MHQQIKSTHGGARAKAGRKPLGRTVRSTVSLTPKQADILRSYGSGSINEGIQTLLKVLQILTKEGLQNLKDGA